MAKSKSEGAEVRDAYDGPEVEHDALIGQIEARAREQHARSSDASESAAKVKEFIEETGLNSQAFSWLSSIVKKLPKKDGQAKAMDIIRSLEIGLPMIKAHVGGQGTAEMDLGGEEESDASETYTEVDEEPDEETAEFNDDVDRTVTPIDFGGAAAVR